MVTGLSAVLSVPLLSTPASAHTTPTRTAPAAPAPVVVAVEVTLRTGSRGPAVAGVQRTLGVSADGVFGPLTRGAVVAFQTARGLVADGIVGPRTRAALGGAPAVVATPAAGPAAVAPAVERASRGGARSPSLGAAAVTEAARHRGKPYVYGAAGPASFDCSGFIQYVYGRLGVVLPHNAAAQYASLPKVAKGDVAVGDLVFVRTGGRISHVGIYAGDNTMWVARRTGTTVTQQTLWTQDFLVARVG